MSILFQHKKYTPPPKEEEVIENLRIRANFQTRDIRAGVKCFKNLGLSFIIDDFHRPDGKIVERTVPTNLETYTDRINGEEYETGNVEDLDYIDKFKIKFLFPIQAYKEFKGIKPMTMSDIFDFKDPTILPVTDEELEEEGKAFIKYLEDESRKPKVIHLKDLNYTSKTRICGTLYGWHNFTSDNPILEKLVKKMEFEKLERRYEVLADELIRGLIDKEDNFKK